MSRSEKVERIREAAQRKTQPATYVKIFIQTNTPKQGRYYAKIPWDKDIICDVTSEENAEKLKDFLSAVPDTSGRV
jgi:hypothetical protein